MDYKEVATETAESAWQKPIKTTVICSGKFCSPNCYEPDLGRAFTALRGYW
jgi:hypothetical protein